MEANFIINPDDKFFPNHHMWTYCIFLGKFTDSKGNNYDLGLYENTYAALDSPLRYSNATVHGNEDQDYFSGELWHIEQLPDGWIGKERILEVIRRAKILNLMK